MGRTRGRGGASDVTVATPAVHKGQADQSRSHIFTPYHTMSVPKQRVFEASSEEVPLHCKTTVMLRNIPNRYTQASLLEEIDSNGFQGTYNFFYVPMDIHNRTSVGYAFINFLTSRDMQAFVDKFTNYKFARHQSQKIARVSPAHIQGLIANVRHFSSCAVTRSRNSQYRPVVKYHGIFRDLAEVLQEISESRHRGDDLLSEEVLSTLEAGASPPPGLLVSSEPLGGLNPQAVEFVPKYGEGRRLNPQSSTFVSAWRSMQQEVPAFSLSSMDPTAKEFVPARPDSVCVPQAPTTQVVAAASWLSTAPEQRSKPLEMELPESPSFVMAKKGFEDTLIKLLQRETAKAIERQDTQSTEGGETWQSHSQGSDSGSPRSASDTGQVGCEKTLWERETLFPPPGLEGFKGLVTP